MQELKDSIAAYEARFTSLVAEIQDIKAGKLDGPIQAELRAVLARKYGKKLLDAWVPEEEEVRLALRDAEATPVPEEVVEQVVVVVQADGEEIGEEASKDTGEQEEDERQEPVQAEDREPSPAASDLSPLPSQPDPPQEAGPAVEDEAELEADEAPATRSGKRKASAQPRGVPQSKRSTRKGTSPAPSHLSEAPSETDEPRDAKRRKADTEEDEEAEPVSTRGRRSGRREQPGPASRTKKAADSPAPSVKTKESSPAPSTSRRAPSVSSNASGTEDRRLGPGRRGTRGRGASKSAREQTVESVKEEEEEEGDEGEEEEAAATRTSTRRGQKREKEDDAPVPVAKRGRREKESARGESTRLSPSSGPTYSAIRSGCRGARQAR